MTYFAPLVNTIRIKNPLAGIPQHILMQQVEEFARDRDMTDMTDLLKRGALVAQNPSEFESIPGITEEEKEALTNEVTHKWRQPRSMYFTVILCSIGAAVQGWDQTGSNGANLSFPVEFGISDAQYLDPPANTVLNPNYEHNLWLVGLINGAPYLASAFIGCWISDPLNNYIGRRGTIFFAAVFCLLPVIGSGCAQNWYELFITRLLLGMFETFLDSYSWFAYVLQVLVWVPKPPPSQSTLPRMSLLLSVVASSCAGNCGLPSVSSSVSAPT